MKYIEAFLEKIKVQPMRPSKFKICFGYRNDIGFQSPAKPDIVEDDPFYADYLRNNLRDRFNTTTRRYEIDVLESMEQIIGAFQGELRETIYKVSPAKRPRQTKFFKEFDNFMWRLNNEQGEMNNTIISLMHYYYENRSNMNSESKEGKTFYALLQAFIKKYKR